MNLSFIKDRVAEKKSVLFRIGTDAGFFSEYNGMIFTMHYCLLNNIGFILNSNDANFSYKKGWQDYFLPFTGENSFWLNKYYHTRFAPYKPVRIRDKAGYAVFRAWLKLKGISFVTSDILPLSIRQDIKKNYCLPGNDGEKSFFENCRNLVEMTWRLQPSVLKETQRLYEKAGLPGSYIGFHIRRGDKKIETSFLPLESYISEAEKYSETRDAFVATDDFTVYEELCRNYPYWKFYTLTSPDERGYHQAKQLSKSRHQIRKEMIKLIASVEILSGAQYFFGTFSSNISIFLALRMPLGRCTGIDFNDWRIWH